MSSASNLGSSATTFTIHRKRDAVAADAKLLCTGKFVSDQGASVEIAADGGVMLTFQANVAKCTAKPLGGPKLVLACGGTSNQDGAFAADCTSVTFGGMVYGAAK